MFEYALELKTYFNMRNIYSYFKETLFVLLEGERKANRMKYKNAHNI